VLIPGFLCAQPPKLEEQHPARRTEVRAYPIDEPIRIDGKLDEKFWQHAPVTELFQAAPDEGEPATQRTEAWIGYDESYLYVGARLYDDPDSIISLLVRRDADVGSDFFSVDMDPYHDKRSGYYFGLYPSGTQVDGAMMNDEDVDRSWDAVWEGKTQIDSLGWTVEFKIPFAQIHFHPGEKQTWGINFMRFIWRKREEDFLAFKPQNGTGYVSHFPVLVGLENIRQGTGVEVMPYITSRAEFIQPELGDPFNNGSAFKYSAGGDVRVALSSNFSLNATINPDFGQVEVDPAVVNLNDVETTFDEKRPFFIEGRRYFNFSQGGISTIINYDWPGVDFFYSRRIGNTPQGPIPDSAEFSSVPLGTGILGAAKITGKIDDSWDLGTIQALTKREYASIATGNSRSEVEVEPLTYYGLARTQKQFNNSLQGIGIVTTVTHRFFNDDGLVPYFNSSSFTTGVDGWTSLDANRDWVLFGWGGVSHVAGSKERILDLQTNSVRYYQRPDADYMDVDSNRTSLDGLAGRLILNKQKGNWRFNTDIAFSTPGFDVNDLGFVARTGFTTGHLWGGYRWTAPIGIMRRANVQLGYLQTYSTGGEKMGDGLRFDGSISFLNYYAIESGYHYDFESLSIYRTRGGPAFLNLPRSDYYFNVMTDNRLPIWAFISLYGASGQTGSHFWGISTSVEWDVKHNIHLGLYPYYEHNYVDAQWVDNIEDPAATYTYGTRYIFGTMDQTTFGAGVRLNWTLTPTLSLQTYVQPLFSAANYSHYKELAQPKSYTFKSYDGRTKIEDGVITVNDEGSSQVSFDDPNFNFKSLRGNAVLRWDYQPGASLYLVWTQSRINEEDPGEFNLTHDFSRLAFSKPDNIFMLKFTYWLGE